MRRSILIINRIAAADCKRFRAMQSILPISTPSIVAQDGIKTVPQNCSAPKVRSAHIRSFVEKNGVEP